MKIYRPLYVVGEGGREGGRGSKFVPAPIIQTFVKFGDFQDLYLPHIFVSFQQSLSKIGNVTHFKAFFPVVPTADIFFLTSQYKK